VSASFQEHLELALGDEYRVVRELGGGGMSRVFLATEVALGRPVVIKVLTPELAAGVNRERFRREVQLAAGLQHPMIVPLLTAGEAEGLLWYTMPFVEGESLRERIQRGVLSQREALPILIDVARALGAAHRKGIVHRDIKPGNILLHESHAVVADFGVAKALTAAVSESTGLTTSGLAVGTPAYMSPEQAAGDSTVDARADIYALGCVAYELLSGKPPFTDPSMARLLVAQVSQTPVPIQQVAPVKSGLASVIMRCLEKDPALRWPTADMLADVLEEQRYTSEATPIPESATLLRTTGASRISAATPAVAAPPHPPARARAPMIAGGAAVAIAAGLAVALSSGSGGARPAVAFVAPQTLLVADVDNRTTDSTLGDLLSEALRTELQESKRITVMTPAAVRGALERMQKPPAVRVAAPLAREIAVREGVPIVVEGRLQRVGNTFLVRAALVSPESGGETAAVQETAASEDALIATIGRLARRLRERLGESAQVLTTLPPMERVTTTSLEALRKYTEAIRVGDESADLSGRDREIALLVEAVTLDSTFAMAWRRLGVRLSDGGQRFSNERNLRARDALTRAYRLRERLSPIERRLAEAAYYSNVERDNTKAADAYRLVLEDQPANRIALNNLASAALSSGRFDDAWLYGNRYVAVDSSNLSAWPWAIWGAYGTGRTAEARRIRALARARFTDDNAQRQLQTLEASWLLVERDWPALEALATRELARSRTSDERDAWFNYLSSAFKGRGQFERYWRLNDSLGRVVLGESDTTRLRIWRGDGAWTRAYDRMQLLDDTVGFRAALDEFRRVSGLDRWRMADRPERNLLTPYYWLRDGRTARERYAALRAATEAEKGRGELPPIGSQAMRFSEALVLMAERQPRKALEVLGPELTEAKEFPTSGTLLIAKAYWDAGDTPAAREWFAAIADSQDPRVSWSDPSIRIVALRALCALGGETQSERQARCGQLLEQLKSADPVMQPILDRARTFMAQ
jgi:tRNA A-37 threonylcarbamoyl transferase component Bud32/tetratricopeptide (TPR) repeat protein